MEQGLCQNKLFKTIKDLQYDKLICNAHVERYKIDPQFPENDN